MCVLEKSVTWVLSQGARKGNPNTLQFIQTSSAISADVVTVWYMPMYSTNTAGIF